MRRSEYEALYGGAAGGGKSDALVAEALRQVNNPNYRAILFRKTFPQCRELIIKSLKIYKKAYPRAKYNGSTHTWTFPSGAMIMFGSMPTRDSFLQYQGHQYAFIGFDELTHFTQEEYEYLISRNRADGEGLRVYIRATANPGGIGHAWVKDRFITPCPPGKRQVTEVRVASPDGEMISLKRDRVFIASTVFDNKKLMENDPNYIANLALLPHAQKQALLYGDWDSFSGQVFTEWRNNPEGYESKLFSHVINPFPIPKTWRRYRSYDFGFAKPFSVSWYAVSPDGVAYKYREWYGCKEGRPNEGLMMEVEEVAKEIRRIEDDTGETGNVIGIADPSIWDKSRGVAGTIISVFEKHGVYFEKGKNNRIHGLMQVHYRLKFDDKGRAKFYVFNTCKEFIRTFPALIYDTRKAEDVDTTGEDHSYDDLRYFFMANPITPMIKPQGRLKEYNPFE